MGFLGKIFGGGNNYPAFEADTSAAKNLAAIKDPLEKLSEQVKDPVELKNNCGECRNCYNTEGPDPDQITFLCPVHAFDDAEETGKIDADRCLRCFLCLRHCYRKYPDVRVSRIHASQSEAPSNSLKSARLTDPTKTFFNNPIPVPVRPTATAAKRSAPASLMMAFPGLAS